MNTSSVQRTARVPRDLEPLLERYFSNRRKDIRTIQECLQENNFEQIQGIGHTMKGSGSSYGFLPITELGKAIEQAAKNADATSIQGHMYELEQYINTVHIEFVDE